MYRSRGLRAKKAFVLILIVSAVVLTWSLLGALSMIRWTIDTEGQLRVEDVLPRGSFWSVIITFSVSTVLCLGSFATIVWPASAPAEELSPEHRKSLALRRALILVFVLSSVVCAGGFCGTTMVIDTEWFRPNFWFQSKNRGGDCTHHRQPRPGRHLRDIRCYTSRHGIVNGPFVEEEQ